MSAKPGREAGRASSPPPSASPPSTPSAPAGGRGGFVGWLLGRPWWQGVGALVTVVAAFIPFLGSADGDGGGEGPRPTPSARSDGGQASTIQMNSGGCNVQGSGNVVTCAPDLEQSYGQVSWTYYIDSLYYTGGAQELPTPPDYPAEKALDHCSGCCPATPISW